MPLRGTSISSTEEIKRRLTEIPPTLPLIDQLLRVAGLLVLALEEKGLRPIVVGGTAVAIYTKGSQATMDVDFVVQGARYAAIDVLKELGFIAGKSAGVWWHPTLKVPVEFPSAQLAGDPNRVVRIDLADGLYAYVIGVEDLIIDRVEQADAQNSPTGDARQQAIILTAAYWDQLDWGYLELKSREKHASNLFNIVKREAAKLRED